MRKLITILILAVSITTAPIITTGCRTPSSQKIAVNTLYSLHKTADVAMDSYLDLIVQNKITTNNLGRVLKAYDDFQVTYRLAVVIVIGDTNATAPATVLAAASNLAKEISAAKKEAIK